MRGCVTSGCRGLYAENFVDVLTGWPLIAVQLPSPSPEKPPRDAINLTRRSLTWIGAFPAPINGVNSGRAGNKHADHSQKTYLSIVIHLSEMQDLKQRASLIKVLNFHINVT